MLATWNDLKPFIQKSITTCQLLGNPAESEIQKAYLDCLNQLQESLPAKKPSFLATVSFLNRLRSLIPLYKILEILINQGHFSHRDQLALFELQVFLTTLIDGISSKENILSSLLSGLTTRFTETIQSKVQLITDAITKDNQNRVEVPETLPVIKTPEVIEEKSGIKQEVEEEASVTSFDIPAAGGRTTPVISVSSVEIEALPEKTVVTPEISPTISLAISPAIHPEISVETNSIQHPRFNKIAILIEALAMAHAGKYKKGFEYLSIHQAFLARPLEKPRLSALLGTSTQSNTCATALQKIFYRGFTQRRLTQKLKTLQATALISFGAILGNLPKDTLPEDEKMTLATLFETKLSEILLDVTHPRAAVFSA